MTVFFQGNQALESSLEGCPDPLAGRAIIAAASPNCGLLEVCHQIRDNEGNPVDLSALVETLPCDHDFDATTTTQIVTTTTVVPATTTAAPTTTEAPTTTPAPTTTTETVTTPAPTTTTVAATTTTTVSPTTTTEAVTTTTQVTTTTESPTTTTQAATTTTTTVAITTTTTAAPTTTTAEATTTTTVAGPTTTTTAAVTTTTASPTTTTASPTTTAAVTTTTSPDPNECGTSVFVWSVDRQQWELTENNCTPLPCTPHPQGPGDPPADTNATNCQVVDCLETCQGEYIYNWISDGPGTGTGNWVFVSQACENDGPCGVIAPTYPPDNPDTSGNRSFPCVYADTPTAVACTTTTTFGFAPLLEESKPGTTTTQNPPPPSTPETTTTQPPTTTTETGTTLAGVTTTTTQCVYTCQHSQGFILDALCGGKPCQTTVRITDAANGMVCIDVPESIASRPGVYKVGFMLAMPDGSPYLQDETLLSIEQSLFNQAFSGQSTNDTGPITIGQIRTRLRDWAIENTAFDSYEFSDAEIIDAMLYPIRMWNETPPVRSRANPSNFPIKELWIEGTTAKLLETSSYDYLRNQRKINYGGGVTEDDKNKFQQYANLAQLKLQQFMGRMKQLKVNGNWGGGAYNTGGTHIGYRRGGL